MEHVEKENQSYDGTQFQGCKMGNGHVRSMVIFKLLGIHKVRSNVN